MTVFVLIGCIDYEGTEVIGVYATQEKADEAANNLPEHWGYDDIQVQEMEVQ
jgi:hypothetical protein